MGWQNPVPNGVHTRGFAPSSMAVDGGMYADAAIRRAHERDPNDGSGAFVGSTWYPHFHAALDIAAAAGTPILAAESGVVLDAQWGGPGSWANGGGFFFRVEVNETCMYLGAHCSDLLIRAGQRVAKGQTIARVGSTGVATGNHLHFWARLGPKPYYDEHAFFWNPALVLPGGQLFNDPRFSPNWTGELPDTGLPNPLRIDGDPAPMRFRNEGTITRTVERGKPIREGASINSKTIRTTETRKKMVFHYRVPKAKLPEPERQWGDVLIGPVYVGGGSVLGYVKQKDIVGN
jgi:hypothetical protein